MTSIFHIGHCMVSSLLNSSRPKTGFLEELFIVNLLVTIFLHKLQNIYGIKTELSNTFEILGNDYSLLDVGKHCTN